MMYFAFSSVWACDRTKKIRNTSNNNDNILVHNSGDIGIIYLTYFPSILSRRQRSEQQMKRKYEIYVIFTSFILVFQ